MNDINKPASLIRDELAKEIISAINKSNLSYFLLDYILKDIWTEVHTAALQQAQAEKEVYFKRLQDEKERNNLNQDINSISSESCKGQGQNEAA